MPKKADWPKVSMPLNAPEHVDRQRRDRDKKGPDQDVHRVGVKDPGAGDNQHHRSTWRRSRDARASQRGDARQRPPRRSLQSRRRDQSRANPCGRSRSTTAASTAMVRPPSIGLMKVLTSTCSAAEHEARQPERQQRAARHHHQHEGVDQPGHAHIRIDARQRRDQRAGDRGEAATDAEGDQAHPRAVDAEPCASVSFMITARVERPSRVPFRSPANSSRR